MRKNERKILITAQASEMMKAVDKVRGNRALGNARVELKEGIHQLLLIANL